MILGTAGHIDHGKTTLVRALTGVDTDRLPEEKRRGITIELGFAPLAVDGIGTIGIVDVPGHEGFVRTMLAGATGIDLALLVIAADEGVMPQTREHLAILDLLGVRAGVVALTKCDLVDAEWLELVEEEVRSLLSATPLADAPIIPTSATSGAGLPELRQAIAAAARSLPKRDADDLFRMPVDRAFTIRGTGTVVTGTVWSGRLGREGVVRILPGDRQARVRGIQSHGAQVDSAEAGNRTAIALAGVDVAEVGRGSVLVSDSGWAASTILRAEVALLSGAPQPLRARSAVRFHLGTAESGARIVVAGGALAPGERKPARIVLDEPVVLRAGDRFVLRSASPLATVGGGIVVDPFAPRRGRAWSDPERMPAHRLALALTEAGPSGVLVATLPVRLGVAPDAVAAIIRESDPVSLPASGRLVAREFLNQLAQQLNAFVEEAHRLRPLEPGMSLQLARSKLAAPAELVDRVIAEQVESGILAVSAGIIRLAGWSARPSAVQTDAIERVHQALVAAAQEPPSVSELTERYGPETESFLRFLERLGRVTQVEQGRYYDSHELELLLGRLRAGMERGREYSPAELREILGSSRKYLIPLLEYCDRVGLTSRGTAGRIWRGT